MPKTGRTHQIRKHLSMFGFPIVNDELYNEKSAKLRFEYDSKRIEKAVNSLLSRQTSNRISTYDPNLKNLEWKHSLKHILGNNSDFCLKCELGVDYERFVAKNVAVPLCLHSMKYKLQDLTLDAGWPKWATSIHYFKQIRRS